MSSRRTLSSQRGQWYPYARSPGSKASPTRVLQNDLLILGVGYDDELIRRVAEDKTNARKLQVFGLPSLSLTCYQQNVIRAARASEALSSSSDRDLLFAPANDPFMTAQALREQAWPGRRPVDR